MKHGISLDAVIQIISSLLTKVDEKNIKPGCMDHESDSQSPLLKPGGEMGDLITVLAATHIYNLPIETSEIAALFPLIKMPDECRFIKELFESPGEFNMSDEDVLFLKTLPAQKKPSIHQRSYVYQGICMLQGGAYTLSLKNADVHAHALLIYHKTLDNHERRVLAHSLEKIINQQIYDTEYLYEILSQVADDQLFTYLSKFGSLPIYEVQFDNKGNFEVNEVTS